MFDIDGDLDRSGGAAAARHGGDDSTWHRTDFTVRLVSAVSGFVVGVDRVHQADAMRAHGADAVVSALAEILDMP